MQILRQIILNYCLEINLAHFKISLVKEISLA